VHHYRNGYLDRLIDPDLDQPLNVNQLQERMQLLLQDGTLAQVNASLAPGDEPGRSALQAAVREGPRFRADVDVADDRPPSVGETGGTVALSAHDLLGDGESLSAHFGASSGFESYGVDASVPILPSLLWTFARYDREHGSVVESTLRELDITSRETTAEAGLGAQLQRSLASSVQVSESLSYARTQTFLLGFPFSFTAGVERGLSKVAALRTALDWTWRESQQVLAVRGVVDVGVAGLRATRHRDTDQPDSRFVAWKSQAQYVRQLFGGVGQLAGRAQLQLANDGLLPAEKIAVGGADTVRGYRQNFLVRDDGGSASLEYRHTLVQLRLPGVSHAASDGMLAAAGFYDYGAAHDHEGAGTTVISSVGAGLRWSPAASCLVQVYKGFPLQHAGHHGDSLQDRGIHFGVSYGVAF
jgi:hemolysin activation/secretion protein